MPIPSFNINDVSVTIGGQPVTDWGDGDVISIEFPDDEFVYKTGVGGSGQRSKNHNNSAVVTFMVQYGTPAAVYLESLRQIDRTTGDGVLPLSVVDTNGGYAFVAASAFMENRPGQSFGIEAADVEYRFRCYQVESGHALLTERGLPFP